MVQWYVRMLLCSNGSYDTRCLEAVIQCQWTEQVVRLKQQDDVFALEL